jgi:hypothetical protein
MNRVDRPERIGFSMRRAGYIRLVGETRVGIGEMQRHEQVCETVMP